MSIWNAPLWLLGLYMVTASFVGWYALKWLKVILYRARAQLFTPESIVLAAMYAAMAFGFHYGYVIMKVSYFNEQIVLNSDK